MPLKDLLIGDGFLEILLMPDERAVISLGSKVTWNLFFFKYSGFEIRFVNQKYLNSY